MKRLLLLVLIGAILIATQLHSQQKFNFETLINNKTNLTAEEARENLVGEWIAEGVFQGENRRWYWYNPHAYSEDLPIIRIKHHFFDNGKFTMRGEIWQNDVMIAEVGNLDYRFDWRLFSLFDELLLQQRMPDLNITSEPPDEFREPHRIIFIGLDTFLVISEEQVALYIKQ